MTASIAGNPYIGPRTFTYKERHLFFGREREARDLLARVVSERLLLFYAQSGAGKSSLLHTRLIPQLQEEKGFGVLPVGRVSGEIPRGVAQVDNIYVFNLLSSIDEGGDPGRLAHVSIGDFLARLVLKDGHWVYDAAVEPVPAAAGGRRYVMIVDQFEEIISTHRARWLEREDFFHQLDQAMAGDPNLWVVLTLREDYVAALDPYAPLVAGRLRARFYMERMGIEAALEAVQRPAELGGRPFAPGVAEKLVDDLRLEHVAGQQELVRGQYVEPVQLQVVCRQLWESIQKRPDTVITFEDLAAYGDVEQALVRFYEDSVQAVAAVATLGVTERQLRRWFDTQLITEAGTRGLVRQGAEATKGLPNTAVRQLQGRFLVRGEARSGDTWIELIHDRLVEPVRRSNRAWFELHEDPLTQAARNWAAAGRPAGLLLHGRDLEEIEARARQAPESLNDLEREFLAASRQAALRQRSWRLAAGAVAAMAIITFAIIALLQSRNAANQTRLVHELETAVAETDQAYRDLQTNRLIGKAEDTAPTAPQLGLLLAATAATNANRPVGQRNTILPELEQTLRALLATTGGSAIPLALQPEGIPWDVAVNQDGGVAIGDRNGTVHLLDLANPQNGQTLHQEEAGDILEVGYSPDGNSLAAAGTDGTVWVWDVRQPQAPPTTFPGHEDQVTALAFGKDGSLLATGSGDETVRVWDFPSQQLRLVISPTSEYSGTIEAVAISPDAQILAVASFNSPARLIRLDRPTMAPIELGGQRTTMGPPAITALAFRPPTGTQLLASTADGTLLAWDVYDPGRTPQRMTAHPAGITDLAIDRTGEWLATAGMDGTVDLWPMAEAFEGTNTPTVLRGHDGMLLSVAFSPDSRFLFSTSQDGSVRRWDVDRPVAEPIRLEPEVIPLSPLAMSADSQHLAGVGPDGTVRVWNLGNPALPPQELAADAANSVGGVAFRDGEGQVMALNTEGSLAAWNAQGTFSQKLDQATMPAAVTLALADRFGQRWALTTEDGGLHLWEPATAAIQTLDRPDPEIIIADLALSADGSRLAAASGSEIWLYDLNMPTVEPQRLVEHQGSVLALALNTNGQLLASGDDNGELVLWDLSGSTPQPQHLDGQVNNVLALGFGERGGHAVLASGGLFGELKLWDLTEADPEPVEIPGHLGGVLNLAISPDGRWLASAGEDGALRLWSVPVTELVDLACRTAGRALRPDERTKYLRRGGHLEAACDNR